MARTRVPLNEAFGRVVRRRRLDLGLSQEELAYKAKLHPNYVGYIERAVYSPTLAVVQALARALGERASELVREAEEELDRSKKAH